LEVSSFIENLKNLKTICIDSSILIYHLDSIKPYDILTRVLIEKIANGDLFCNISALSITELLAKPCRLKDYNQVLLFENFITSLPNSKIQPVDYSIAKNAASLRGEYNLRTPDSILLSTALGTKSDAFITNDILFKKINSEDIKIFILDEQM